jgi:hypothetical protein
MLTQKSKDDIFKLDIQTVCKHFAADQKKNLSKVQLDGLAETMMREMSKCL